MYVILRILYVDGRTATVYTQTVCLVRIAVAATTPSLSHMSMAMMHPKVTWQKDIDRHGRSQP